MAKSTLDAGWSSLKTMLEYKSRQAGVIFEEVNEAYSTQICSSCGEISDNSPKGRADLNKRSWKCHCGSVHDRDINGALNILAFGHEHLVVGIPVLQDGEDKSLTSNVYATPLRYLFKGAFDCSNNSSFNKYGLLWGVVNHRLSIYTHQGIRGCQIFCVNGVRLLLRHSFLKLNTKLIQCSFPVPDRHIPFLTNVS